MDARVGHRRAGVESGLRRSAKPDGAKGERESPNLRATARDNGCRGRGRCAPASRSPRARWCRRCDGSFRERLLQRADDKAAHEAGIGEAHLRFRGMHIDVDDARIAVDEERDDRMAVSARKSR